MSTAGTEKKFSKDSDFSTRTTPPNSVVDKKPEIHWESAVKNHLLLTKLSFNRLTLFVFNLRRPAGRLAHFEFTFDIRHILFLFKG